MTTLVIGLIAAGIVVLVVLATWSLAVLREYERGWCSGWGMCVRSTPRACGSSFRFWTR